MHGIIIIKWHSLAETIIILIVYTVETARIFCGIQYINKISALLKIGWIR